MRTIPDHRCCSLDDGHAGACLWTCTECHGRGTCWDCKGSTAFDDVAWCDTCDGTGQCPTCNGSGEEVEHR